MRERSFVVRRQEGWERLEELLALADRRGLRAFGAEQLTEIGRLYRAATSDLATARSREYSPNLTGYINRLTARAHAYVYAGNDRGGWDRFATFFTTAFPREVRASWKAIAVCTAVFLIATLVSYVLVAERTLNVYALLPGGQIPQIRKSLHDSNFAFDSTLSPVMSSLIISNNIKVAALAFAGGMTGGILTLWAIFNNGLMLGGLAALFAHKGFGLDFWATIAPHGVIELSAIALSGGAGLLVAGAIVAPGRLRRSDALKRSARRAGTLICGVAAMLVVAGIIEGFISPLRTPIPLRLGIGALSAVLLASYLALAGRAAPDAAGPPPAP
jgi:uncharacterized membrane protein SpoIIM required for sporulation